MKRPPNVTYRLPGRVGTSAAGSLRPIVTVLVASVAVVALAAPSATPITEARLLEAAAAGGSLTLPAGSVVLSQPLVIRSDLWLGGAGPEVTTIRYSGSGAALRVEGGARVELRDLRIDASSAPESTGSGADLVQVLDGALLLDRVYLSGARYGGPDDLKPYGYGAALYVTGTSTATVSATFFQLNGLVAVEATGRATVELQRTSFDRNAHGVLAEDGASLSVTNSLFVKTEESALTVRGRASATIVSSSFTANGVDASTGFADSDALRIGDEARVTLVGNSIEANPRYALSLYGAAQVRAESNTFRGNGGLDERADMVRSAVLLEDSARYVGNGDVFVENPGGAIEVIDDGSMLLDAATFTSNGSYATAWVDDRAEVVLVGLTMADNEGGLLLMGEATLFLERGSFTTTAGDAVEAGGTSNLTVVEATFSDNDGAGIYGYGEARVTVARSRFESNLAGVVAAEEATVAVSSTTFVRNVRAGALFLDASSGEVRGSVFEGNDGVAVDLRSSAVVVVEANEER